MSGKGRSSSSAPVGLYRDDWASRNQAFFFFFFSQTGPRGQRGRSVFNRPDAGRKARRFRRKEEAWENEGAEGLSGMEFSGQALARVLRRGEWHTFHGAGQNVISQTRSRASRGRLRVGGRSPVCGSRDPSSFIKGDRLVITAVYRAAGT